MGEDVVERVAKAMLYDVWGLSPENMSDVDLEFAMTPNGNGAGIDLMSMARAALEALREPTPEMLQPACNKHTPGVPMPPWPADGRPSYGECPRFDARRRIWASMISAALDGGGE